MSTIDPNNPLADLEHWDEFLQGVYPEQAEPGFAILKDQREFRDYRKEARPSVKEFYRLNHRYQTHDFVESKRREFLSLDIRCTKRGSAAPFLLPKEL